jgi:hypothetical protein
MEEEGSQTLRLAGGAVLSGEGREIDIGSANSALLSTALSDMSILAKHVRLRILKWS